MPAALCVMADLSRTSMWSRLPAIETLYAQILLWPTEIAREFFEGTQQEIAEKGYNYAQPSTGDQELQGTLEKKVSWKDEVAHQHHITTYIQLLEGTARQ